MSKCEKPFDWLLASRELLRRMGEGRVHSEVLGTLQSAPVRPSLLVACSGGADSIFMLCWLHAQASALNVNLLVAHYNHRWRGGASDEDAAFVRSAAAALQLGYFEGRRPDGEDAFTETAARSLRLNFLRAVAKEHGCDFIAYGHQLDDILETQLQRLARGCGSEGLAAPRPVARFEGKPTHLRPLLNLRAGDIRMALRSLAIPWREDASNSDTGISRNALRAKVIPSFFDALDRDPIVGAARSRQLLEEDAAALDRLAREAVPQAFSGAGELDRSALCNLPSALLRRALSAWLSGYGLMPHFGPAALDRLIGQCRQGLSTDRFSAGPFFIRLTKEQISIEKELSDSSCKTITTSELKPGRTIFLPGGANLKSSECICSPELFEAVLRGSVDPRVEAVMAMPLELPLKMRGWLPGDRFHPLGAPGSKKLQDWFVDHRVPVVERKSLPVVTTVAGEIIWVPGAPPAERLKLTRSTKQALRLTYRTGNSP